MGQRDVQHQGFQDLAFAAGLGEDLQAPHHLQPVRQFQDGHAGIGRILDDQLLVILGLQARILGLDGGNLVQALHQGADGGAPVGLLHGKACHAAGFVQIDGGDAFLRKADFIGHDPGHGIRVADERRPVVAGILL